MSQSFFLFAHLFLQFSKLDVHLRLLRTLSFKFFKDQETVLVSTHLNKCDCSVEAIVDVGRHQSFGSFKGFESLIHFSKLSESQTHICVDLWTVWIYVLCSLEKLKSFLILFLLHQNIANTPETFIISVIVNTQTFFKEISCSFYVFDLNKLMTAKGKC